MSYVYEVHGLVLGSNRPLPELAARARCPSRTPDVRLEIGEETPITAARLETGDGRSLVDIPGAGRFVIANGRDISVAPATGADPSIVRLFALGSAFGLVCHQRGLLVLHASAVAIGGTAIAFVADQGRGKSTLAAHCLARERTRLVADDVLAVSFDDAGRPWAQPGMPSVKLWRDALAALGRDPDGLQPDWLRADKFHLPSADRLIEAPVPLGRIYLIDDDPGAGPGRVAPITGAAVVTTLITHTYRIELIDADGQRREHFAACARLAEAVPVARLARRRDLAQVGTTAAIALADPRGELTS